MYPQEQVARFIGENFIPARVHVREQPEDYKRFGERYGALWTPTILVIDPDGTERHRVEGFLEADDLLAQLELGLGHSAFQRKQWPDAERHFESVLERYPSTDAAPEAQYWAGVARYRASGNNAALSDTARAFTQRYQNSPWAKKSVIWRK